ncbi:MAG TPA: hypothetical protein PKL15_01300 [Saprospiraceae bacterium]|nr:hypothetical protein [Saprospiraceae bacterium]
MFHSSTTGFSLQAERPRAIVSILPDFILADVIFGSPREDCAGTGICKIEAIADMPSAAGPRECRRSRAALSAPDPQTLVARFRRSDLCSHLLRNYFRYDVFHLPQSCELPGALAQAMHLSSNVLQPGCYPIRSEGDCFVVTFEV